LGARRVDIIPRGRGALGPIRLPEGRQEWDIRGRVDITDGAERFFVWRLPPSTGCEWWITLDDEKPAKPLDPQAFDQAMVRLLG
jgi:hypothetical protein